jgi:hypothetical protein
MAKVNNPGHAKPDSRMLKRGYLVNLIRTSAPKKPEEKPSEKKREWLWLPPLALFLLLRFFIQRPRTRS